MFAYPSFAQTNVQRGQNVQRSAQEVLEVSAGLMVELVLTAVEEKHDQQIEGLGPWRVRDPASYSSSATTNTAKKILDGCETAGRAVVSRYCASCHRVSVVCRASLVGTLARGFSFFLPTDFWAERNIIFPFCSHRHLRVPSAAGSGSTGDDTRTTSGSSVLTAS